VVHFSGKYFKINGARLENPDTPVSITVAAKRRKMMQLAAKHADIWESSYLSPEEFASINSEFEKISNPTTKRFMKPIELDVIIANSNSELEYKKRLFTIERGPAVLSQLLNLICSRNLSALSVLKNLDVSAHTIHQGLMLLLKG
jgi:alkanesulfonate monooxygenase SsuD/methylene tetrahydromethanopterin reductase-like flavin-dependent oxidoreductase (luciferase family)